MPRPSLHRRPNPLLFTVTCSLFTFTGLSAPHSADWGQLATISSTMGVNAGRLCLGEASRGDIGCPIHAPYVASNGNLGLGTTLPTTQVYLRGTEPTLTLAGNNANQTESGRIRFLESDTTAWQGVYIRYDAGSTGATDRLEFGRHPSVTSLVADDVPMMTLMRNNGFVGIGLTSPTTPAYPLEVSGTVKAVKFLGDGSELTGINSSGSLPTGAIMAFDLTACPSGWSEYTPARGRFLRGIDNGAGNDPSGTRIPGDVQEDGLKSHSHDLTATYTLDQDGFVRTLYSGNSSGSTKTTAATGGAETRPKNVAVLFCRKN